MARLGEIEYRGDGSDPKQLLNYMLQLEEQIKYALAHLGSENIQAGAIDEKLLAPAVKQNIQNIEIRVEGQERKSRELKSEDGKLRTLILETEEGIMRDMEDVEAGLRTTITETAAGINTSINDKLGNYYTKSETATEINTRLGNALGDYYTKTETAQKIQTDMGDALGNYYTKSETAGKISAYVSNNAYGLVSGVDIVPAGVRISGGKYVRIDSGGQFIVDNGTFGVYSSGNSQIVKAGGFYLYNTGLNDEAGYLVIRNGNSPDGPGIALYKDNYGQPSYQVAFALNRNHTYMNEAWMDAISLYDPSTNSMVDVTSAILNSQSLLDGWIKDASVSGNTLTLTKWDGTTVNFTKPAGAIGSLLIESVSGYTNRFAANQYNSGNTSVVNSATCEMYLDESAYTRNTWACVREVGGSRAAYLSLASYWDAAQSDFYEVTQTTLKPEHISIRYADGRVTVFYNDQTFKVYYESA